MDKQVYKMKCGNCGHKITMVVYTETCKDTTRTRKDTTRTRKDTYEDKIYQDMMSKRSIFVSDVITFKLFLAYVIKEVNPDATQRYCKGIFKDFARPLMAPENRGIARRLKLICPEITVQNQYVPEKIRQVQLFSVRHHMKWIRVDASVLKKEYIKAYCNLTGMPVDSAKIKNHTGDTPRYKPIIMPKPHVVH